MIHVVLSDFTSDQLERLRRERDEAASAALAPQREAEKTRQAEVDALHRDYREAWAARQLVRALTLWFRILFTPDVKAMPAAVAAPMSDAEHILRSGDAGQRVVIDRLASQLDDQWVALSGYTNHRGEIDAVLIGPDGIACIEIKALNAQLTIDGDDWVRRRIGRRGDVLDGPSPVLDKGGRSPSRQLNEPTEHLDQWLQRHGFSTPIQRWVVLAHANSTLGSVRNLTVDAVAHVAQLNAADLFARRKIVALTTSELIRLRDLIERDHRHQAARRARASATPGRAANASVQGHGSGEKGNRAAPAPARAPATPPDKYADLPVHPLRRTDAESLQDRRISVLADMSRRVAAGTAGDEQRHKLLEAVVHDLVMRDQPSDVPRLLVKLRREPAVTALQEIIDEAMQVFEFPDRSLVGLVVPVSVRNRSFGEEVLTRSLANPSSMRVLEPTVAKALSAQRVIFDRRLYVYSDLADVGAKQWRDYLLGLEARGGDTDPVATQMTIGPQHDGSWVVACVVGVAVCDPDTGAVARRWGRINLKPVVEGMFETAMLGDDSGNMMPATMQELASWGLWTLRPGLQAAAAARHRISMGLQGASDTFSTARARSEAPGRR